MTSGVPAWLGERKVKLLGLDVPSVDHIEAKVLTNHHALAGGRYRDSRIARSQ
jgi:kynurenine formamidase